MELELKKCSLCNLTKPLTEFYKLTKVLYRCRCKDCHKLSTNTYYKKNIESYKVTRHNYVLRKKEEREREKERLEEYDRIMKERVEKYV